VLFHRSDNSSVLIIEQRDYSVNAFEIFVRRDGAQGALEKKERFLVFSRFLLNPVGWGCYVVKARLDRRRLPEDSTTLTSRRTSG
jgi:hypothetical protein